MKQGIPRPARDMLARQMAANEHPSADLLSGFAEHGLTADENARVAGHLASCADCRDIVFLANAAAEPEHRAAVAQDHAAMGERVRWASWKWLAPALALVVIVVAVTVQRIAKSQPATTQAVAVNRVSALPSPEAKAAPENEKLSPPSAARLKSESKPASSAKAYPENTPRRETTEKKALPVQQAEIASSVNRDMVALPRAAAAPPPPMAPAVVGGPVQATSTAPVTDGARTQSAAGARLAAKAEARGQSGLVANAPMGGNDLTFVARAAPKATAPPLHWRITNDGHLERSTSAGVWMSVLAEQPVIFRVVAVIGNEVWAGGSDGALFHSTDNGDNWGRIALIADGQPERSAVNSIRFDTPAAGRVTTDGGATWTTVDGGKTWTRQ